MPERRKKKTPKSSAKRATRRVRPRTVAETQLRLNRRTRVSDTLIARFCKHVARGVPPDTVCDYMGIDSKNFWVWIRKGQLFLDGDGEPESHRIYGVFVLEMKRAFAKYKIDRTTELHESSKWNRALAILERRDRKTWGKQDPLGGQPEDFDPDEKFL